MRPPTNPAKQQQATQEHPQMPTLFTQHPTPANTLATSHSDGSTPQTPLPHFWDGWLFVNPLTQPSVPLFRAYPPSPHHQPQAPLGIMVNDEETVKRYPHPNHHWPGGATPEKSILLLPIQEPRAPPLLHPTITGKHPEEY
ncbi:hypothetical protein BDK51DRAFT_41651 [Blyttiomyces helicus]|uniref:Uncharacterized protein n=1 Tax=Blyttiomyces helicus TaxID=388810 RepID=A0A4P9WI40_9FUNG|nr:hypothetical protein BDK51DRAFT_41651 [Blyttiomyces helicus]|eukprot:RKO91108.1 hypothetical protein BDK51DRAFT_41651 [Blyttiomyces helicus]